MAAGNGQGERGLPVIVLAVYVDVLPCEQEMHHRILSFLRRLDEVAGPHHGPAGVDPP